MKFFYVIVFLLPSLSFAALNVSLVEEPEVYRAIDQLISFRLIDKIIMGHRPWSRLEVARLIKEAKENLPKLEDAELEIQVKKTLKSLEEKFEKELEDKSEIHFSPFSQISWQYLYLDSPTRKISPVNTGAGDQINALINPLISYRLGRNFSDTNNFSFETRHSIDLTKYVAITGRSNFLVRAAQSSQDEFKAGFDDFYLRSEFKNIGIQLGRDVLAWGQSSQGGVFHSTNATPLDMLKISNIHPFYYPWVFKYLGPSQISFYSSLLEANRDHPHPYIIGYKFSFLPHKDFEFGFTNAIMAGGEGSPQASFARRVSDVFGFLGEAFGSDPNISNRVGGFDFSWRLPILRGAKIYYEVLFEDLLPFSHWNTMFVDEAIHQAGLFFPRLNRQGTETLRLEYQYSGYRPYRHSQYTSGWTRNQRLMGSELGPNAYGLLIEFDHQLTSHWHQKHSFAFENRDSDLFALLNAATVVKKIADNPSEKRFRWMSSLDWNENPQVAWNFLVGYERVRQFNFTPGLNTNNFLVNLKMTVYPKF